MDRFAPSLHTSLPICTYSYQLVCHISTSKQRSVLNRSSRVWHLVSLFDLATMWTTVSCFAVICLYLLEQGLCHRTCLDEYGDCDVWSALGKCHRDSHWMHAHCSKSCRTCSPSIHSSLDKYGELTTNGQNEEPVVARRVSQLGTIQILYDGNRPRTKQRCIFCPVEYWPSFRWPIHLWRNIDWKTSFPDLWTLCGYLFEQDRPRQRHRVCWIHKNVRRSSVFHR